MPPAATAAFTNEQIVQALAQHARWLRDDAAGKQADFARSDLTGRNFSGVNLSKARMVGAICVKVNFEKSLLSGVDFFGADLSGANLGSAYWPP